MASKVSGSGISGVAETVKPFARLRAICYIIARKGSQSGLPQTLVPIRSEYVTILTPFFLSSGGYPLTIIDILKDVDHYTGQRL